MDSESHIRNPVEWGWAQIKHAGTALGAGAHSLRGADQARDATRAAIRRIGVGDLRDALAKGLADFAAARSDVIFLCLIYPIAGLLLARLASGYDMLPLIFPMASGFALIGPLAAIGLYEMSRRREQGLTVNWADAFGVIHSPALAAILSLGIGLLVIFVVWLFAANAIYDATLGPQPPASLTAFASDVLGTGAGRTMIVVGCGVGMLFALLVLTISVVSFPLLLDRDVGLLSAIGTSARAVWANPGPMLIWGLIVAGGLVLGALAFLVGLAIVLPVLGHATWHLYRKLVAR